MPKRSRATGRPGQRRPLQRSANPARDTSDGSASIVERPDPTPVISPLDRGDRPTARGQRPGTLTAAEEARAAELEAQILAEERATAQTQRRGRARTVDDPPRSRDTAPLSVRAAAEYAYVRRDIRRIGALAALLLVLVVVLYLLINVAGVIRV